MEDVSPQQKRLAYQKWRVFELKWVIEWSWVIFEWDYYNPRKSKTSRGRLLQGKITIWVKRIDLWVKKSSKRKSPLKMTRLWVKSTGPSVQISSLHINMAFKLMKNVLKSVACFWWRFCADVEGNTSLRILVCGVEAYLTLRISSFNKESLDF